MKCPNCNCEMGTNVGICQYCGFDVGKYYERTMRMQRRMEEPRYEASYWTERQEKQSSERFHIVIIITMLAGVLILQMLTLILLVLK